MLIQAHEGRIDCAVDLGREPDAMVVDIVDQLFEVGPDLHLNVHTFNFPHFPRLALILGLSRNGRLSAPLYRVLEEDQDHRRTCPSVLSIVNDAIAR